MIRVLTLVERQAPRHFKNPYHDMLEAAKVRVRDASKVLDAQEEIQKNGRGKRNELCKQLSHMGLMVLF